MNTKYKNMILLAASGILTGLAVTYPKIFGIFEWVSMIPLIYTLLEFIENREVKLSRVYLYGLLYFELFYMVGFHFFLYLYPLDFTGLDNFSSVLVIAVAWLGLSFLQALFGGIAFMVFVSVGRSKLVKKFPITGIFSFPIIYTAYEYTQTLGWWGVPWSRLPLGQTDLLLPIQTASLFGSYFVTALIVLVNTLLCYAVKSRAKVCLTKRCLLAALTVFTLNTLAGGIIYAVGTNEAREAEKITVGVVQGNYDSTEKWFTLPAAIVDKHIEYTKKCAEDGAQLVIWAETALPFGLDTNGIYAEQIKAVAEDYGITVLVGCMQYEGDESYNAIVCFLPDGTVAQEVYYKRHLVPFGEYVPMRSIIDVVLPFLSEVSMLSDDMSAGTEPNVFETELGAIGSLICFDSIYEALILDTVADGAGLLALSTNDSWFSDSAGIYMHNSQARLRSVEVGRFTARSANTGVSSFITNTGVVLSEIPPLTEGYLTEDVAMLYSRTLYSVIGNTFVYVCAALCLCPPIYSSAIAIYERKKQNTDKT